MGDDNNTGKRPIMQRLSLMLGHGRALETYLIGYKLLTGFTILMPGVKPQNPVLTDLLWMSDYWLSVPFLLIGTVQLVGVILNMNGIWSSWLWRTVGAAGGILLWTWFLIKTCLIGAIWAGSISLSIVSLLASIFLLWRGLNHLPRPGVPGLL